MNEQVQQLLAALQDLANKGEDGCGFDCNLDITGGVLAVSVQKKLDPLPDNVIQFPRKDENEETS
jgi:hypothetical protein